MKAEGISYNEGFGQKRRLWSKSPIKLRHSWVPLSFLLITLYRNQEITSLSLPEALVGLTIALLSFLPLFIWASKKVREQPAFQCFCAIHFPYYAYPILTCKSDYMRYPEIARLTAGFTVVVYLVITNVIYHYGLKRQADLAVKSVSQNYRGLTEKRAHQLFTLMLTVWCFYICLFRFGYVHVGSLRNIVHTFAVGNGTLGAWFVFRAIGERRIVGPHAAFAIFMVCLGEFVSISIGSLIHPLVMTIVVVIAYTLGRNKIPWLIIIGALSLFSFLNLGKAEMRNAFWRPMEPTLTIPMIFDIYDVWIPACWDVLIHGERYKRDNQRDLMNRANLIHVQARVVNETPEPVPYLWGETYSYVPISLIPRFIWKNKPSTQTPTNILGLRYRLTNYGNIKTTTVAIGFLAEAWANFGWMGVLGLAVVVGYLMRYMAVVFFRSHEYSIRSMLSVVWITVSFQIELTVSTWFSVMVQAMFVLLVVLYPLTNRKRAPATNYRSVVPV